MRWQCRRHEARQGAGETRRMGHIGLGWVARTFPAADPAAGTFTTNAARKLMEAVVAGKGAAFFVPFFVPFFVICVEPGLRPAPALAPPEWPFVPDMMAATVGSR